MFPVGMKHSAAYNEMHYPIEECAGFNKEKEQSVEEYFKAQGIEGDLGMIEKWKHLLMRMKQTGLYGDDLDKMFVLIFYDYDNPVAITIRKKSGIEDKEDINGRFQQMLDLANKTFKL